MQKKVSCLILAFLIVAFSVVIHGNTVSAKSQRVEKEKDGYKIILTVDQESYREEEPIQVQLQIENQSKNVIQFADVVWKCTRGVEISALKNNQGYVRFLAPGESKTIDLICQGNPEYYGFAVPGWYVIAILILDFLLIMCATLVILFLGRENKQELKRDFSTNLNVVKTKKEKKNHHLFYAGVIVMMMSLAVSQVHAYGMQDCNQWIGVESHQTKTMSVATNVKYAGKIVKLQAEVVLVIEQE